MVANEPFDGIWLRLTATEPGTCRLAAADTAIESGVCRPMFPDHSPAVVEGDSLAYLTKPRRIDDAGERGYELGATGHGPVGEQLAKRLCIQIRAWDHDRITQPTITAYPADTSDDKLPSGLVIDKQHTRLVLLVD